MTEELEHREMRAFLKRLQGQIVNFHLGTPYLATWRLNTVGQEVVWVEPQRGGATMCVRLDAIVWAGLNSEEDDR